MGWLGGLADWTDTDTAYISVVFSWMLPEAYQRAAAQAKVERLRGIITNAEWFYKTAGGHTACPICSSIPEWGHTEDCAFYQWEAAK